jgi:hypothetical protein
MRYVDWGLVSDDLIKATATTFFQAPSCATCNGGGPNGYQNGIRYIPIVPTVNPLALACQVAEPSPWVTAFYNTTSDGLTCPNPPIQTGSGSITGTKSAPEFLVIDNGPPGGTQVTLSSSGSASGCSDTFAGANWGIIFATGDLNLQNLTFSGFIYTNGSIYSHGHVLAQGGIISNGQANLVHTLGTLQFCAGVSVVPFPLTSMFYTFTQISWQDRPSNQP